jgi:hypothetical protein
MRALVVVALVSSTLAAEEPRRATADGAHHRLLELYTSEGCSSCPPAEAWLSENAATLQGRGIVPLAFHIDYWDKIGWPDRFAKAQFTARQVMLTRHDRAQVYTPAFFLDGHELPRAEVHGRLATPPPPSPVKLTLEASGRGRLHVVARAEAAQPVYLSVAIFESGLVVDVARGENAGKRLRHDFVVRQLFSVEGNEVDHEVAVSPEWHAVGVAAFVTDARSGEVLQAVALPPP